ncbi:hypothetical protein KDK77_10875, partial [bacterium]|nr:hypothetical protein [bacterium]
YLYGIENHTLYRQNLSAFLHSLPYQENLIAFCNTMSENSAKLKPHIYSKELLTFDTLTEDFHNNQLDFVQYCQQLVYTADENLVDHSSCINLNKIVFLASIEESISFDKIEGENHSAIKELSIHLTHDQSREMLEKEFSFRTKKIASETYYRFLYDLFVQHNLSTGNYPNLQQYIVYLTEYQSINQADALAETDSLTAKIYKELIRNDTQQTLHDIGRYIGLMSNFCRLKMTRHYINSYRRYRNIFSLDDCIRFLKKQGTVYHENISADYDLPSIHASLANFEDFYAIAHQREQALVDNLLSLSARDNSDTIVCVAGGFHTDGITSLLKSKDISYIVITPNTIHDEPPIPYISLLQNIRTPLEQMLTTQTSTLKIASWLTENMPLAYEERKTMLSAKLKTLLTATKLHDLYQTALRTYTPNEQIILKNTIENQLRDSINNVIKMAQYENILTISAVHLTQEGLMAEIRFSKSPTSLFVGYSSTAESPIYQHALLETVNLPSGIAEHFFGSTELLNVTTRYTQERSRILSAILQNTYTFDQLHTALNSIRSHPYMNTAALRSYIEALNA